VRRDWTIFWTGLVVLALMVAVPASGAVTINPLWLAAHSAKVIVGLAVAYFGWAFFFAGLTSEEKRRVGVIAVLFFASAIFWAGFEQVGSSFSIFAERFTVREFAVGTVPAGWFQSINPLLVILLAPVVAALWVKLARRSIYPSLGTKFACGLLLLAAGFLISAWAAQRALAHGPVWATWLISVFFLHTVGELFLSPVGLSAVTKLSPARLTGQMMGVWFLGTSLGNLLAGLLAGEVTAEGAGDVATQMPAGFLHAAATAGVAGIILLLCARSIQRLMPGVK
jgi:POT family proton-dependent oligopeptide transporter